MKKNKLSRLVILMLALAMASMMLVSGTYAKYTSEIAGSDSVSVAKWAWEIGNDTIESAANVTGGFTLDLFDSIYDTNSTSGAVTTTAETDVDTNLIAPGTCGKFQIDITNNSEVNATYAIELEETSNTNNVPIEYSIDGGSSWVIPDNTGAIDSVSATNIAMNGGTGTLTVDWRWAFTGDKSSNYTSTQTDATDTALGFAANTAAPTVAVTATITVTQVN